jgi:hypothetical protein
MIERAQRDAAELREVDINLVQLHWDAQPRDSLIHDLILEYVEAMEAGDEFPPVEAYSDGTTYWVWDGFHRVEAAIRAGRAQIATLVRPGTLRDAIFASCGANARHGQRRTTADKQRAVHNLLADPEWSQMSDRAIADACAVSHMTVYRHRREMAQAGHPLHRHLAVAAGEADQGDRRPAPGEGGLLSPWNPAREVGRGILREGVAPPARVTLLREDGPPTDNAPTAATLRDGPPPAPDDRERYIEWYLADRHKEALRDTPYAGNVVLLYELACLPEERQEASVAELLRTWEQVKRRPADHQLIHSSASNEWYTPAKYVEAAREVLGGIDCDPASCPQANQTVRATTFYSKEDDGLAQSWYGRVFLNPPYGKTAGESNAGIWAAKLLTEYEAGRVEAAILLVNTVTGNEWFTPLKRFPMCLHDGRIKFIDAEGQQQESPTNSNVFIYLGSNPQAFRDIFGRFGRVVGPWAEGSAPSSARALLRTPHVAPDVGQAPPGPDWLAILSGPRSDKVPGSVDWCRQTVVMLKASWHPVEKALPRLAEGLDDVIAHEAWNVIPPEAPYGSLDAMLRAELEVDEATIRAVIRCFPPKDRQDGAVRTGGSA